jgi:hypothetical protein
VPADHKILKELQALIAEDRFDERLNAAIDNPNTDDAKEIRNKLLRMLSFSTKGIPFSPAKRKSCVMQLYSLVAFAGLPSIFHTINPADMDLLSTVKLSQGSMGLASLPNIGKDYEQRSRIVAQNPAYASNSFHRFIVSVLEKIFGADIESSHVRTTVPPTREKNMGVFGLCRAQYSVGESQGRGSLHLHGLTWAQFDPRNVHNAFKSGDDKLISELRDRIDCAFYTRNITDPPNYQPESRPSYGPPPLVDAPDHAFEIHKKSCVETLQIHRNCKETCGSAGHCRFGMPAIAVEATGLYEIELDENDRFTGKLLPFTRSDDVSQDSVGRAKLAFEYDDNDHDDDGGTKQRPLLLMTRRPEVDNRVVSFNPTLTALAACNTCIVIMGTKSQAEAVLYYIVKYVSKNSQPLEACLVPFREGLKLSRLYPSKAEDASAESRKTKYVLNKFANKHIGASEVSSQMAFSAILGNPSEYSSVQFTTLSTWAAVSFLMHGPAAYDPEDRGPTERITTAADTGGDSGQPATDNDDDGEGDLQADDSQDSSSDVDDDEGYEAFDEALQEMWDENDEGDPTPFDQRVNMRGYATIVPIVDKPLEGNATTDGRPSKGAVRLIPKDTVECYAFRGKDLAGLCLYEYVMVIRVIKRPQHGRGSAGADSVESDGEEEGKQFETEKQSKTTTTTTPGPGRHINPTYDFAPTYPHKDVFTQQLKSKFAVPLLMGRRPPSIRSNSTKQTIDTHAKYMTTLFRPWSIRNVSDWRFYSAASYHAYLAEMKARHTLRYRWASNIAVALHSNSKVRKLVNQVRHFHPEDDSTVPPEDTSEGHSLSRDAVDAMNLIRQQMGEKSAEDLYVDALVDALSAGVNASGDGPREYNDQQAQVGSNVEGYAGQSVDREDVDGNSAGWKKHRDAFIDKRQKEDDKDGFNPEGGFAMRLADTTPDMAQGPARRNSHSSRDAPVIEHRGDDDALGVGTVAGRQGLHPPEGFALDPSQMKVFEAVMLALEGDVPESRRLILMHGGPGTGKSRTTDAIAAAASVRYGQGSFVRTATTGIAGCNIQGETIHHVLGLPCYDSGRARAINKESNNTKQQFQRVRGILIDEISMAGTQLLYRIDKRLREITERNDSFGGLVVLFAGDFYQLEPVASTPLYKEIIHIDRERNAEDFLFFELDRQHRVVGSEAADERHKDRITRMRSRASCKAAIGEFLAEAPILRLDRGEAWPANAVLAVVSNKERAYSNKVLIERDARARNKPIARFSLRKDGRMPDHEADINVEQMFYYMEGAPGVITRNICVKKGVANGTRCILAGISYNDVVIANEMKARLAAARSGQVVNIATPTYIIVTVPSKSGSQEVTTVAVTRDPTSRDSRAKELNISPFEVELAYCCTYHKVQGLTLDNIVMEMNARPNGLGKMCFASLYVGLSRVRTAGGIRLIPERGGTGFQYLRKLSPPNELEEWVDRRTNSGSGHSAQVTDAPSTASRCGTTSVPTGRNGRDAGRGTGRDAGRGTGAGTDRGKSTGTETGKSRDRAAGPVSDVVDKQQTLAPGGEILLPPAPSCSLLGERMKCPECNEGCTSAHSCGYCHQFMHGICGASFTVDGAPEEGYGCRRICSQCLKVGANLTGHDIVDPPRKKLRVDAPTSLPSQVASVQGKFRKRAPDPGPLGRRRSRQRK